MWNSDGNGLARTAASGPPSGFDGFLWDESSSVDPTRCSLTLTRVTEGLWGLSPEGTVPEARGFLYLSQGRYDEAEPLYLETRKRVLGDGHPDTLNSYVNMCDALIQFKRPAKALEACEHSASMSPDNPDVFYNLAGAYMLSGRQEEALEALRKDLELGDRDWEYLESDPGFESLQSDPQFQFVLQEMRRSSDE